MSRHDSIIVIKLTAAEHAARTFPLAHNELAFATDTGEARMGPGMWATEAKPFATVNSRVRVATTANITRATALNAGDTLDGVVLKAGDLVLVKNQSTANENGVYVVSASPARAAAYDTYDEHSLKLVYVEEGTANANKVFRCTSATGGTLNTTDIVWLEFPKGTLSLAGLSEIAGLSAGTTSEAGTGLLILERANGIKVKLSLTNLKASLAALP